MRRFAFLTAVLFAGALPGAETIRQIVPPAGQTMAVLQAPQPRGEWSVFSVESFAVSRPQVLADASLCILAGSPGRYVVGWRAGSTGKWISVAVDLGGVAPDPQPKPPDPPKPPAPPLPKPVAVRSVVVVCDIRDPADDVDIAEIGQSGKAGEIAAWCTANGVLWRAVDVTEQAEAPNKDVAAFVAEAKGKKLPWIVGASTPGVSGAAVITISARCPADVEGVLKLLRAAGAGAAK